jgi:hypothetical protein
MKISLRFILTVLVSTLFVSNSYCTKDLNEYGKWLKFYDLKHEDFQKYGNDIERKIIWSDYDLANNYVDIYRPFFIYSPDSSYFIDLDSYSLAIEMKDGKQISYGSGIDMKVQVIRLTDNKSATLLFCGSACIPETANWITDSWVEIVGFSIDENDKMIPTKWKVDLDNMIFSEYRINKSFDSIKDFYYEKERLKTIEFIKE